MKIAVIGSGIAGLSAAYRLTQQGHHVTLLEANDYFGGHTHTVDVTLDGHTCGVDTGFLVFNEKTYPHLLQLFDELDVATAPTDMSFSVKLPLSDSASTRMLEWAGASLDTVFAQRRNLLRPRFLRMLRDIARFNKQATALAASSAPHYHAPDPVPRPPAARPNTSYSSHTFHTTGGLSVASARPQAPAMQLPEGDLDLSLGEFLERHGYGAEFIAWYLLPMAGCIWSCPTAQMMDFPVATFIRFCDNHGLLQVTGRPQWRTVRGGARHYVDKMLAAIDDKWLGTPVISVKRGHIGNPKVAVTTAHGTRLYDHVVLATHSDQSLALLKDADAEESAILGAVKYHPNQAVLHTDASVLPANKKAWSAWNYASEFGVSGKVCVHYLINQLQPVPFGTPLIVSLNPMTPPDPASVMARYAYAHPVFDHAAIDAQHRLGDIQGRRNTWFAGAWTGYGFHEDGLKSGLAVALAISALDGIGSGVEAGIKSGAACAAHVAA